MAEYSIIYQLFQQVEDPVSKLHLLSFAGVREHLSQPFALESAVEHKQLGYSGIVDCVARLAVSSTKNADEDVVLSTGAVTSYDTLSTLIPPGTRTNFC